MASGIFQPLAYSPKGVRVKVGPQPYLIVSVERTPDILAHAVTCVNLELNCNISFVGLPTEKKVFVLPIRVSLFKFQGQTVIVDQPAKTIQKIESTFAKLGWEVVQGGPTRFDLEPPI